MSYPIGYNLNNQYGIQGSGYANNLGLQGQTPFMGQTSDASIYTDLLEASDGNYEPEFVFESSEEWNILAALARGFTHYNENAPNTKPTFTQTAMSRYLDAKLHLLQLPSPTPAPATIGQASGPPAPPPAPPPLGISRKEGDPPATPPPTPSGDPPPAASPLLRSYSALKAESDDNLNPLEKRMKKWITAHEPTTTPAHIQEVVASAADRSTPLIDQYYNIEPTSSTDILLTDYLSIFIPEYERELLDKQKKTSTKYLIAHTELTKHISQLEREKATLTQDISDIESKRRDLETKYQATEKTLNQKQIEHATLEAEVARAQEHQQSITTQIADLEQELTSLSPDTPPPSMSQYLLDDDKLHAIKEKIKTYPRGKNPISITDIIKAPPKDQATGDQATGDQATGDQATGDLAKDIPPTTPAEEKQRSELCSFVSNHRSQILNDKSKDVVLNYNNALYSNYRKYARSRRQYLHKKLASLRQQVTATPSELDTPLAQLIANQEEQKKLQADIDSTTDDLIRTASDFDKQSTALEDVKSKLQDLIRNKYTLAHSHITADNIFLRQTRLMEAWHQEADKLLAKKKYLAGTDITQITDKLFEQHQIEGLQLQQLMNAGEITEAEYDTISKNLNETYIQLKNYIENDFVKDVTYAPAKPAETPKATPTPSSSTPSSSSSVVKSTPPSSSSPSSSTPVVTSTTPSSSTTPPEPSKPTTESSPTAEDTARQEQIKSLQELSEAYKKGENPSSAQADLALEEYQKSQKAIINILSTTTENEYDRKTVLTATQNALEGKTDLNAKIDAVNKALAANKTDTGTALYEVFKQNPDSFIDTIKNISPDTNIPTIQRKFGQNSILKQQSFGSVFKSEFTQDLQNKGDWAVTGIQAAGTVAMAAYEEYQATGKIGEATADAAVVGGMEAIGGKLGGDLASGLARAAMAGGKVGGTWGAVIGAAAAVIGGFVGTKFFGDLGKKLTGNDG